MGRPKGSKNKPKQPVVASTPSPAPSPVEEPKKRGRPPGTKNPVASVPQTTKAPETAEVPKRRGRPPGSKNQGKDDTAATPPAPTPTPTTSTSTEEPKRRGRPPKVVVPSLPTAQASTPPMPAGAKVTPSVPSALVVTRTEAEDDEAANGTPALYTEEQLNNPALDSLEEHAKVFLALASAHRKVMFEGKASASMTVERGALKTLIDFFEIDVEAIIKNGKTQKSGKATTGGTEK